MRKILLVIATVVLSLAGVDAQQEYQLSQNMFNQLGVNPAYAGVNGKICGTAFYRNQWIGFEGSPTTSLFSIDAPFSTFNLFQSGAGLSVISDKAGALTNMGVRLSYAGHFSMGKGKLSVGLMAKFLNTSLDFAPIQTSINDGYVQAGDPLLLSQKQESDMVFDMGFGAYYRIEDQLYVGLSTTQMLESTGKGFGSSLAKPNLKRHYYLTAGTEHGVNVDWKVMPSLFVKTDASSMQVDVNVLAEYREFMWGGLSYRHQDAVVFMYGMYPFVNSGNAMMSPLRFGLAYDVTTSGIPGAGSVELMLSYCFKIVSNPIPSIYRNIRYL